MFFYTYHIVTCVTNYKVIKIHVKQLLQIMKGKHVFIDLITKQVSRLNKRRLSKLRFTHRAEVSSYT